MQRQSSYLYILYCSIIFYYDFFPLFLSLSHTHKKKPVIDFFKNNNRQKFYWIIPTK